MKTWIAVALLALSASVLTIVQAAPIVLNQSFEDNGLHAWPGYGSIDDWTRSGTNSGLNPADNGDDPFNGGKTIPDGSQIAFIQRDGSISQTISGLEDGSRYIVKLYSAHRGNGSDLDPTMRVNVDGTEVHASLVDGGKYWHFTTRSFIANGTTANLSLISDRRDDYDETVLFDMVTVEKVNDGGPYVEHASFENYSTKFRDNSQKVLAAQPTELEWTFTGASGLTREDPLYSYSKNVVEGSQAARISGDTGRISQTVSGLTIGDYYYFTWWDAERSPEFSGSDGDNIYDVYLTPDGGTEFLYLNDRDPLASDASGSNWAQVSGDLFQATATSYTLSFQGTIAGDHTILLDAVEIAVPEPASVLALAFGALVMLKRRSARRQ